MNLMQPIIATSKHISRSTPSLKKNIICSFCFSASSEQNRLRKRGGEIHFFRSIDATSWNLCSKWPSMNQCLLLQKCSKKLLPYNLFLVSSSIIFNASPPYFLHSPKKFIWKRRRGKSANLIEKCSSGYSCSYDFWEYIYWMEK